MPTISVSPRIAAEDYEAFKALLPGDADMPATFEEWQSNSLKSDAKRVKSGHRIQGVPVKPGEFSEYCRGLGRPPSSAMLIALAVAKAARTTT